MTDQDATSTQRSTKALIGNVLRIIGTVADVAAIAGLFTGSRNVFVLTASICAFIIGTLLIIGRWHQPVNPAVLLGALIAVAGAGSGGYALAVEKTTVVAPPGAAAAPTSAGPASSSATTGPSSSTTTSSTTSSTTSPPPSSTSTGQPADTVYLSDMHALATNSVHSPVPVTIGTRTFPNSFEMGCTQAGTSATWALADYREIRATVGLDKNQGTGAAVNGLQSTIQVYAGNRQLGPDYVVSITKTADLAVPLDGAVQVTIKCRITDSRGTNGSYYQVAFGDARAMRTGA